MCSQYSPNDLLIVGSQPSTSNSSINLFSDLKISSSEVWKISNLSPSDFNDVKRICREAFPLDYPESWFEDVVIGRYISFGLYHRGALTSLLVAEIKTVAQCDKEDSNLYHDPQAPVVYILSLAVSSAYQRQGIATLLLNNYYFIDNSYRDGYTFVLYTNNARPPWSFKEFCNVFLSFACLPFRWLVRWKIC